MDDYNYKMQEKQLKEQILHQKEIVIKAKDALAKTKNELKDLRLKHVTENKLLKTPKADTRLVWESIKGKSIEKYFPEYMDSGDSRALNILKDSGIISIDDLLSINRETLFILPGYAKGTDRIVENVRRLGEKDKIC
jgi:hypothetical protein